MDKETKSQAIREEMVRIARNPFKIHGAPAWARQPAYALPKP
jgi:hypothetical protein